MPGNSSKKNLERSLSADADRCQSDIRLHVSSAKNVGSIEEEVAVNRRQSAVQLPSSHRLARSGSARFPKLQDCAHFHYESVDISCLQVTVYEGAVADEDRPNANRLSASSLNLQSVNFNLQVQTKSNHTPWIIERSLESLSRLDRQLHQCVFDRKYSLLPDLHVDLQSKAVDQLNICLDELHQKLSLYFQRLSAIAGNMINCGAVLSWFEMDNRGNRVIVSSDNDCAINIPAVGAALVVKRYVAQAPDEISLEVGEMISLIDMPSIHECNWWRGKRKYEVGFFPADHVETIAGKVPSCVVTNLSISQQNLKPVLRRQGKFIVRLRAFFSSRPARSELKQSGIVKERVFGCDLGEHLLNSGHDVPEVLKFCTEVIEMHGVVDGIYRLSGIASNIQKLRTEFDADNTPSVIENIYLRDIHSISSLLKMYFRELPNPLLTYQLYDKFVNAIQDKDYRLIRMHDAIQQLPPPHYRTCAFLMRHLNRMASFGKKTSMTVKNLAIVWAPNLLRCKELEQSQCSMTALRNIGTQAVVTEFLINYADLLFSDNFTASIIGRQRNNSGRRQARPKSLAVSTPTKLLSLEEARMRAFNADSETSSPPQTFLDVGGGPAALPQLYHTVIDLPKGRKLSSRHKKSASSSKWKDMLHRRQDGNKEIKSGESTDGTVPLTPEPFMPETKTGEADQVVTRPVDSRRSRLESTSSDTCVMSRAPPKPRRTYRTVPSRGRNSPTPYSTPAIDNCSLEDVTPSSATPAGFGVDSSSSEAVDDLILHRPRSVGGSDFGAELFASLSATVRRSLQGSLSDTQTSHLTVASGTVISEVLNSSDLSTDEVFESAGSRECSASPLDSRRTGQFICDRGRSRATSGKYSRPLPGLPETCGSQERRIPSESFYSLAASDSDSEPLHGSREEFSFGNHPVPEVYSEDEEKEQEGTRLQTSSDGFRSPVNCSNRSCARTPTRLSNGRLGSHGVQNNSAGDGCAGYSLSPVNADGNNDRQEVIAAKLSDCSAPLSVSATARRRKDIDDVSCRAGLSDSFVAERCTSQLADTQNLHSLRGPRSSGNVEQKEISKACCVNSSTPPDAACSVHSDQLITVSAGRADGVSSSSSSSQYDKLLFIDDDESETNTVLPAQNVDVTSQLIEKSLDMSLNDSTDSSAIPESSSSADTPFRSPPSSPTLLDVMNSTWYRKLHARASFRSEVAGPVVDHQPVVENVADSSSSSVVVVEQSVEASNSVSNLALSKLALSTAEDHERNDESCGYAESAVSSTCAATSKKNGDADGSRQTPREAAVPPGNPLELGGSAKLTVYFVQSTGLNCTGDLRGNKNQQVDGNRSSPKKKTVQELKSKFEPRDLAKGVLEVNRVGLVQNSTPHRYTRSISCQGFGSDNLTKHTAYSGSVVSSKSGSSLPRRSCIGDVGTTAVIRATRSVSEDVDGDTACFLDRSSNASSTCEQVAKSSGKATYRRDIRQSVDDDPRYTATGTRYQIPSVSARISCFEPLLSSSVRKSPEFQTIPESKRARLSSCGSAIGTGTNQTSLLSDSNTIFEAKDGVDAKDDGQSPGDSCFQSPPVGKRDLCKLLDIPPSCVKSFPKVSERKRLFEVDSVSSVKSALPVDVQSSGAKTNNYPCVLSDKTDAERKTSMTFGTQFVSDAGKENKFDSTDLNCEVSGRRKLFDTLETVEKAKFSPPIIPSSSQPASKSDSGKMK